MNKIKIKYYTPIINAWDNQLRLCKNTSQIYWEGNVHERLRGYSNLGVMEGEEFALLHPKQLERQIQQNKLYSEL